MPVMRALRVVDNVVTVIGFIALAISVIIAIFLTGFFAMATDSCFDDCNTSRVGIGLLVSFVGFGVAVVVATVGAMVAARRDWIRLIWPLLGIVVVVLAVFVGGSVADTASG